MLNSNKSRCTLASSLSELVLYAVCGHSGNWHPSYVVRKLSSLIITVGSSVK